MAAPARTAVADTTADGSFARQAAAFRNWVEPGGAFPPASGRYLLYVSLACPWANRCLAFLSLKGLEHCITVSIVHPVRVSHGSAPVASAPIVRADVSTVQVWARSRPEDAADTHCGWQFRSPTDAPVSNPEGKGSFGCAGCVPDPLYGSRFVRDLYERQPGFAEMSGVRFTVPVLLDRESGRIVSNESSDIIRMFNSRFNEWAEHPELDLYPEPLRPEIDAVNEWVYNDINNGVYRCGFATSQSAYEAAFTLLYQSLDRVEALLSKQRYVAGARFTEADVRLFMTLIRFDEVYAVYFKTNGRLMRESPHTLGWLREMMQMPGLGGTINMQHIKLHYYTSHPLLNVHAIVPVGFQIDYSAPHGRDKAFKVQNQTKSTGGDEHLAGKLGKPARKRKLDVDDAVKEGVPGLESAESLTTLSNAVYDIVRSDFYLPEDDAEQMVKDALQAKSFKFTEVDWEQWWARAGHKLVKTKAKHARYTLGAALKSALFKIHGTGIATGSSMH